jgi:hypothetical protein
MMVRARNGDPIAVSYDEGIWYIGSNAQQLCSACSVVRFDADEFLRCPGCDSVFEPGLLDREFWFQWDRMIEAMADGFTDNDREHVRVPDPSPHSANCTSVEN